MLNVCVYSKPLFLGLCWRNTAHKHDMVFTTKARFTINLRECTSESAAARPESIRSRSYAIWADWVRLKHIQTLSDIKRCLYYSNQYTHLLTTQPIIIEFWTCLDSSAIRGSEHPSLGGTYVPCPPVSLLLPSLRTNGWVESKELKMGKYCTCSNSDTSWPVALFSHLWNRNQLVQNLLQYFFLNYFVFILR